MKDLGVLKSFLGVEVACRYEVRYLKGSPGQGLLVSSACDLSLTGWCDSDSAGCPVTRRSITGWIVFFGGSPISWKTKKQHTVSRYSAEAEYRSMAAITVELKWLKALSLDFGDGTLWTTHVSTEVQLADIFTKGLGKTKFHYLLRKLGVSFLPTPT
ncbi:hypothetical protein LIER_13482 [Lithospermum erythrorhizon]|uniref:Uncharacterized protein n=1 Tax=Lithospermum erythrorhizon TaxID=34254 RepID=A0AAV3Q0U1_LITER